MNKFTKAIACRVLSAGCCFAAIVLIVSATIPVFALNNGLAKTPPMGWNSWNHYFCNMNQTIVLANAKAMVTSGMKAAGYRYVCIDDCWIEKRDGTTGKLVASTSKFPMGMKAMTDSIHAMGLLAGIYEDVGPTTCAGYPGSFNNEAVDAQTFADWGFDFIKNDWCNAGSAYSSKPWELYARMRDGVKKAGRPMVLSICEKGMSAVTTPYTWSDTVGNMWRTCKDINTGWGSVDRCIDATAPYDKYAKPGAWNDADMLQVGNVSWSDVEFKTHFSVWCVMACPLIAGNDLSSMTSATTSILANKDAIAVNQDSLGIQGKRIRGAGSSEVYVKPMRDSSKAVLLLNRTTSSGVSITVNWSDLGWASTDKVTVLDLWTKTKTTGKTSSYTASGLGSHGSAFLRMTNEKYPPSSVSGSPLVFDKNRWENFAVQQTRDALRFTIPSPLSGYTLAFTDMLGKRYTLGAMRAGEYSVPKKIFSSNVLVMTVSLRNNTVFSKQFVCLR